MKLKYLCYKIIKEEIDVKTINLYHGTCEYNANKLINSGWAPNKVSSGGNMGNSKYLYLSSEIEDARWFANEKGCNSVVLVKNIPLQYLQPDPEDEAGYEMWELLYSLKKSNLPRKFVLTASLQAKHFYII